MGNTNGDVATQREDGQPNKVAESECTAERIQIGCDFARRRAGANRHENDQVGLGDT